MIAEAETRHEVRSSETLNETDAAAVRVGVDGLEQHDVAEVVALVAATAGRVAAPGIADRRAMRGVAAGQSGASGT